MKLLNKPEYFFRPIQLLRRLARWRQPKGAGFEVLHTSWGLPIEADVRENIGFSLWHLGVYDLVVSEALWRLADPGELHVDVGANLGYMTGLLATRAGKAGQVLGFEPHPDIFTRLESNVRRWAGLAPIQLVRAAVSNEVGTGKLCIPREFATNTGLAYLDHRGTGQSIDVPVVCLDQQLGADARIGVMKVDTEGGEVGVFEGARHLFGSRRIRDLVFEDHGKYPTPAMLELEKAGFSIHRLRKSFFGPRLADPKHAIEDGRWEPVSYVATLDEPRLRERLRPRGWRVLTTSSG